MITLDDIDRDIRKFENVLRNAQNILDRTPREIVATVESRLHAAAMRRAQHARAELSRLRALRDDFLALERYAAAQPNADDPRGKRRIAVDEAYALVVSRLIKPGDTVILACNGVKVTVRRVSATTITTTGGAKWGYSEIVPVVNGRPMTPNELAQEARQMLSAG